MERERQRVAAAPRADIEHRLVVADERQERVQCVVVGSPWIDLEPRRDRGIEVATGGERRPVALDLFAIAADAPRPSGEGLVFDGAEGVGHRPSVAHRIARREGRRGLGAC